MSDHLASAARALELDVVLEKVKRGTWEPPMKRPKERNDVDPHETVRVSAYRWGQRRKTELAHDTRLPLLTRTRGPNLACRDSLAWRN